MWMVDPLLMCRQHLLGEHSELHKFLPSWRRRYRVDGRVAGNAIEPASYLRRHDALAKEMVRRGFRHESPCEQPDFGYLPPKHRDAKVDTSASIRLLSHRCERCRQLQSAVYIAGKNEP